MRQKQNRVKTKRAWCILFGPVWRSNNRTGLMRTLFHSREHGIILSLHTQGNSLLPGCLVLHGLTSQLSARQAVERYYSKSCWKGSSKIPLLLQPHFLDILYFPDLLGVFCIQFSFDVFKFTPLFFLVIFQLLRLFLFYFSIVHIHLLGLSGGFLSLKNWSLHRGSYLSHTHLTC